MAGRELFRPRDGSPPSPLSKYCKHLRQWAAAAVENIESITKIPVFGSRYISNYVEYNSGIYSKIPPQHRARILLFDWWIANYDRSWGVTLQNPNMLWEAVPKRLHIIDHNTAFTVEGLDGFWKRHAFRNDLAEWTSAFRKGASAEMSSILKRVPNFWKAMPRQWRTKDSGLTQRNVIALLRRFEIEPDEFWGKP